MLTTFQRLIFRFLQALPNGIAWERLKVDPNGEFLISVSASQMKWQISHNRLVWQTNYLFIMPDAAEGRGGEGMGLKKLIRGGSAPRSDPSPFNVPFLTEKIPLSYTFHWQLVPLSYTFQTGSLLVIFMLRSINKNSTIVRCVCSKYFNERPF